MTQYEIAKKMLYWNKKLLHLSINAGILIGLSMICLLSNNTFFNETLWGVFNGLAYIVTGVTGVIENTVYYKLRKQLNP